MNKVNVLKFEVITIDNESKKVTVLDTLTNEVEVSIKAVSNVAKIVDMCLKKHFCPTVKGAVSILPKALTDESSKVVVYFNDSKLTTLDGKLFRAANNVVKFNKDGTIKSLDSIKAAKDNFGLLVCNIANTISTAKDTDVKLLNNIVAYYATSKDVAKISILPLEVKIGILQSLPTKIKANKSAVSKVVESETGTKAYVKSLKNDIKFISDTSKF